MPARSHSPVRGLLTGAALPAGGLGLYLLARLANEAHQARIRRLYGRRPAPGEPPFWPFTEAASDPFHPTSGA